jgi:hypothetical protein
MAALRRWHGENTGVYCRSRKQNQWLSKITSMRVQNRSNIAPQQMSYKNWPSPSPAWLSLSPFLVGSTPLRRWIVTIDQPTVQIAEVITRKAFRVAKRTLSSGSARFC